MVAEAQSGKAGREIFRSPSAWPDSVLVAILVALAVAPYLGILANGFAYDDNTQVLNNPYLQNFAHLREIFSTTVWSYVGAQGVTNYYRPMMTFGYLICYQIFGPLAYGFHFASLALHAGVVGLLFLVTRRMTANRLLAFAAGALFAVHPIHVESVAWIAAVTDLQLTFFYLLTFLCFLRLAAPGGGRSPAMQLAMAGGFVLTLLAKEQAFTLPALATVYEHTCRDDRSETTLAQKAGRYYLLWLLAATYLLFRARFFGALAPVLQISDLTWPQTFLSATALFGQYMLKLLWPAQLCTFYVFHRSTSLLEPRVLLGLVSLLVVAVLLVVLWRHARVMSFALLWLLATLAPVLNPRWMAANVFTERYLYLPSVGFSWLVAWAITSLWERWGELSPRRQALAAFCGVVAALYILRIVTRVPDWSDDITLYTRTLAISPDSYHIRNNLATIYWKQGRDVEAERQWEASLRLAPRSAVVLNNLGLLRSKQKRYEEAAELLRRAMRLKPNYTDPHINLGRLDLELERPAEAELQFRAAVALSPLNVDARNKLGTLYLESGRWAEAEEQYRASAASQPNWTAYYGIGEAARRRADYQGAERAYLRAVELAPVESQPRFALGAVYVAAERNAEALREYQAGLANDPSNAEALAAVKKLRGEGSSSPRP
ncbi:MAG: tetratricopeptide repeat protein [Terriglobia bacterium]|jgi:tetratricopeptide (TPR) repeat protein